MLLTFIMIMYGCARKAQSEEQFITDFFADLYNKSEEDLLTVPPDSNHSSTDRESQLDSLLAEISAHFAAISQRSALPDF